MASKSGMSFQPTISSKLKKDLIIKVISSIISVSFSLVISVIILSHLQFWSIWGVPVVSVTSIKKLKGYRLFESYFSVFVFRFTVLHWFWYVSIAHDMVYGTNGVLLIFTNIIELVCLLVNFYSLVFYHFISFNLLELNFPHGVKRFQVVCACVLTVWALSGRYSVLFWLDYFSVNFSLFGSWTWKVNLVG